MEPVYRALGVVALASSYMSRTSGNGIPLNWLIMAMLGLFLFLVGDQLREALAHDDDDGRATPHLALAEAITRPDMLNRRVALKGRLAEEHALAHVADKDDAPDRAWIPMFNPERTRAIYVEIDLEDVPSDDLRDEWITGMLRPIDRDLKSDLMTSGRLIDGIAPDANHMLVAGERPARLWIWLPLAALFALSLLSMLLVVPLRYTVFRTTRERFTGVDLSATVAPAAPNDAQPDPTLRVTGRFALTPSDTQHFLNVPAAIAEMESGETAFISNIDASIDHMGAIERRAGVWIIVLKTGTLAPPEYGHLYVGFKRYIAMRLRFIDAMTGKASRAILTFASPTTRDRVREALYDQSRRTRVELTPAPPSSSTSDSPQHQEGQRAL